MSDHINFDAAKFIAGVAGMTAEQIGVYWVVCALLYESNGTLQMDDVRLKKLCGVNYRRLPGVLRELIQLGKLAVSGDQAVTNRRVSSEIARTQQPVSGDPAAPKQRARQSSKSNDIAKNDVASVAASDVESDANTKNGSNPSCTRALVLPLSPEEDSKKEKLKQKERNDLYGGDFAAWWQAYPCKSAKLAAARAYRTARKTMSADALVVALARYRASKPLHWAHGATWLRGERWNDPVEPTGARFADEPEYRGTLL